MVSGAVADLSALGASQQSDVPTLQASVANVLSEFVMSAYRSGVKRPVSSIMQLTGLQTHMDVPAVQLDGAMKAASMAGAATGQILDFLMLNKFATRGTNNFIAASREASLTAKILTGSPIVRSMATSATVGFINGALLTPTNEGETAFRRIGNGFVDATSFAALGGVGSKYAGAFGNNLLGRVGVNALAGVAGGAANSLLDPISRGRAPELSQVLESSAGWAAGGVLAGEAMTAVSKGLSASIAPKHLESTSGSSRVETRLRIADTKVEKTAEVARRSPPQLDMLSMREIAERGEIDVLKENLDSYYPELQRAFPLPGEIESPETYIGYLTDPEFPWEMEQLKGKDGNVRGGLQYQILDVNGEQVRKVGWLEHIWVKDGARSEGLGSALLNHVQTQIKGKGGDLTMWEFNDPDKMTPEEINEDAKGGITTQDRVDYWAKRGSYVLVVPSTGELAAYAQPGMEGQEPVPYLSTAWNAPEGLAGKTLPVEDYKKTLLAAHSTIVDVGTDPTVKEYIDNLNSLPDTHLNFVRMSDYLADRLNQLQIAHQLGDGAAAVRRNRWSGAD